MVSRACEDVTLCVHEKSLDIRQFETQFQLKVIVTRCKK